jgi:pimeloyl-ACP methyl ester carboxylesterase
MNFRTVRQALYLLMSLLPVAVASAQKAPLQAVRTVVLVHGAFADSTSWDKVIPLLKAKGLHVVTVDIPLTSFADDVALTKSVLAKQKHPVLLVGHSYGGAVITEAGVDPKVSGLVYLAAFAPTEGQALGALGQGFPKPPGLAELQPQPNGFLKLSDKGIREDFAQDLDSRDVEQVIAHQIPFPASGFGVKLTAFAWKTKPAWYIVSTNDRIIDPENERSMAKTIGAEITEIPSSHVVMLSHPQETADLIIKAAKGH